MGNRTNQTPTDPGFDLRTIEGMSDEEFIRNVERLSQPFYRAYVGARSTADRAAGGVDYFGLHYQGGAVPAEPQQGRRGGARKQEVQKSAERGQKGEKRFVKKRAVFLVLGLFLLIAALLFLAAGAFEIEFGGTKLVCYSVSVNGFSFDGLKAWDFVAYVGAALFAVFTMVALFRALASLCAKKDGAREYKKRGFAALSLLACVMAAVSALGVCFGQSLGVKVMTSLAAQNGVVNAPFVLVVSTAAAGLCSALSFKRLEK